ncbi:sulfur dioxygenase [Paragonimus westermani]|uniref:Persulfide dioxygenase ETHE1, mitochondrial n=1 Tax=Paragonimus westermani TaxID=34504 RepID=A0A5J4NZ48_9TREM|nr:sulfur dioxygenase [Paragonimus westermani]
MCSTIAALSADGPLLFRQLFESISCTFTYILADRSTKEALIIDPVLETVDRDTKLINELDLKLGHIVNTHVHADHVTGSGMLKQRFPLSWSVLGKYSDVITDQVIRHGDLLPFGRFQLECRSTPGHTTGCMTLVLHAAGLAFTGDALLIRGCGRTDFQNGSADQLYDSVHSQILSLPDHYLLFPAHNYSGLMVSSVGEEKRHNPRFVRTKAEFVELMNSLNLAPPKQFERAMRLNAVCGIEN